MQENGTHVFYCLHNITSVMWNETLLLAPLTTGPKSGNSYFIGWFRGQSEITLNAEEEIRCVFDI